MLEHELTLCSEPDVAKAAATPPKTEYSSRDVGVLDQRDGLDDSDDDHSGGRGSGGNSRLTERQPDPFWCMYHNGWNCTCPSGLRMGICQNGVCNPCGPFTFAQAPPPRA
jgi:hypothetical protein